MTFNFLYADIEASPRLLEKYVIDDWVHALNPVTASTLRGGLLSGCNVRFLFITNIGKDFRIEDEDYKQQGLYIFPSHLYYQVLDKWHIDNKAQILLTPHSYPSDLVVNSIIRAARDDFRELHDTKPVSVLDNAEWKARIAMQPGFNGKNVPHNQGH
ncbi:MAG TPA: hypothetical protein VJ836_07075 [Candidatus Saccharimonadales bacterium]|nr:hypothetical protein [Candidatus Saccharimonadales bacterium]